MEVEMKNIVMSVVYAVILGGVILAAIGLMLYAANSEIDAPPAAAAPELLSTATLHYPGVTETILPLASPTMPLIQTPTPNAAATVAYINWDAAQKNLEAANIEGAAIVKAAEIAAQAAAIKAESDDNLAQAAIVLQERRNEEAALNAQNAYFAMRRDEIHSSLVLAEKRSFGDVIWGVALICLSIAMVISAWLRRPNQVIVERVAGQTKQVTGLMEKETDGNGWDRIAPIPDEISVEMVYFWLRIALDNKDSLAVDAWESRKDSPFKSPLYRRWHRWLTDPRHRFLAGDPARRNITILSERGRRYFVQRWMPANPLPYRSNDPESATIATVTTGIVATGAEGEGVLG